MRPQEGRDEAPLRGATRPTGGKEAETPPEGGLVDAETTGRIIRAFFDVYGYLGYGFLESVYQEGLSRDLVRAGLFVQREVSLHVMYKGESIGFFRADLIVERRVIIETKSVVALAPAHHQQLMNYLRATGIEVGLLLNFGPEPQIRRADVPRQR